MKKLLSIAILVFSISAFSQVEKIEPSFWWAEMQNPELQLLVYGKNIADYSISISDNIPIINIRKTENPNYQFVTISTQNVAAGTYQLHFSKKGKRKFSRDYQLKKRNAVAVYQ